MKYMINVSKDGLFLFRTDWDWDRNRVKETYNRITKYNPDLFCVIYKEEISGLPKIMRKLK